MQKQNTLATSFSLQGKGLHTGLDIQITFNPAPENHGYKIKRVDLPDQPVIDAVEMPLFIAGRAFDSRGVGLLDILKPGRGFRHIQKIPDVRFLCLFLRRLFKGSRLCLLLLCSSAVQRTVFLRNRDIPSSPGKSAAASRAQQKEDKQRCQEPISSFLHFLLLSHRQACL